MSSIKVGPQLTNIKGVLGQIELNEVSAAANIAKQMDEIAEIKLKLETLEGALVKPKLRTRKQKREKVAGYIEILSKPK